MVLTFPSTHLVSSMSSIILLSWLDSGLRLKLALRVKDIYFADIYYRETLSFHDLFMTGRTLRLWFNINCTILFTSGADLNIVFQTALSSTTITSHSVQGIDDVYAIFNKYRQLDQFHGHILFGLQDLLWCGYWCVCITLLYLDLRLLQC